MSLYCHQLSFVLFLEIGVSITYFIYTFIVIFNYTWMYALHKKRFISYLCYIESHLNLPDM